MNSSHFMDKQIMGLSGSQSGGELLDLMSSPEDNQIEGGGVMKKEEIAPSYDFQPIRTVGSSPHMNTSGGADRGRSSWGSADSKLASARLKYAGILESHELPTVSNEKEKGTYDVAIVAEIDRTVKKYADNLLHALEVLSSRLSQLEGRTHNLEFSVDELKESIGNSNGSTDGRLRQLENILREVQTGVQVLRDKQDIVEAQLHLAKLQASKGESTEPLKSGHTETQQQPALPQQPIQQPQAVPAPPPLPAPSAVPPPPPLPAPVAPNAPPPPQQFPPSGQYTSQLPPSQVPLPPLPQDPYYPPPGQQTETTSQHYQMPSQQPPPPPPQQYQSPPQFSQYSQAAQPLQPVNPSQQHQPPLPHHPGESAPYMPPPSQAYPPSIRQPPPLSQQPSGTPPSQQFYGPNPGMYEPPASRPSSGQLSGQLSFPSGYGSSMGPALPDPYPFSGSPSHYSSAMKPSPFSTSAPSSGGSNYSRLPTAQLLPQAQQTGSSSSGGPTGNRMPIDDVVDKVSTMGFSREQVRATVRKLTENGQSVDLNVVLDKLMNDGEIQPQKGWFGR